METIKVCFAEQNKRFFARHIKTDGYMDCGVHHHQQTTATTALARMPYVRFHRHFFKWNVRSYALFHCDSSKDALPRKYMRQHMDVVDSYHSRCLDVWTAQATEYFTLICFHSIVSVCACVFFRFACEKPCIFDPDPPQILYSPKNALISIHSFITVRHNFQFKVWAIIITECTSERPERKYKCISSSWHRTSHWEEWLATGIVYFREMCVSVEKWAMWRPRSAHTLQCWIWILWSSTMIQANAIIFCVPRTPRLVHMISWRMKKQSIHALDVAAAAVRLPASNECMYGIQLETSLHHMNANASAGWWV